jgi:hypothetical protein
MRASLVVSARWFVCAFAVLLVLALAPPAAGQAEPADEDQDGVADAVDQCAETPPGDLVDPLGCSICPCDETAAGDAWASHRAYVDCVVAAARAQQAAGTLRRKQVRAAIRRAKKATCGNEELTRCCVYALDGDFDDAVRGRCRFLRPDDCDALDEQVDWAEDIGGGSCTPNPCVF